MAAKGVLKWGQKQYVKTELASWQDVVWYKVPVVGTIDLTAIARALLAKYPTQSSYGAMRWRSGWTVQPLEEGFVLVKEHISICD
jgi:hypothetical protein